MLHASHIISHITRILRIFFLHSLVSRHKCITSTVYWYIIVLYRFYDLRCEMKTCKNRAFEIQRTSSRSLLLETFIWMKSHFLLQCTRVSEYFSFEDRQRSTTTKETEVRCNDRSSSRSVVGARNRRNDFEKLSFYFYMGALSRSLTPRQRHLPYILHPRVSHMYVWYIMCYTTSHKYLLH